MKEKSYWQTSSRPHLHSMQTNYTLACMYTTPGYVIVEWKKSSQTQKCFKHFCFAVMTLREKTPRGGKLNRRAQKKAKDAKETCRLCTEAARKHKGHALNALQAPIRSNVASKWIRTMGLRCRSNVLRRAQWHMAVQFKPCLHAAELWNNWKNFQVRPSKRMHTLRVFSVTCCFSRRGCGAFNRELATWLSRRSIKFKMLPAPYFRSKTLKF